MLYLREAAGDEARRARCCYGYGASASGHALVRRAHCTHLHNTTQYNTTHHTLTHTRCDADTHTTSVHCDVCILTCNLTSIVLVSLCALCSCERLRHCILQSLRYSKCAASSESHSECSYTAVFKALRVVSAALFCRPFQFRCTRETSRFPLRSLVRRAHAARHVRSTITENQRHFSRIEQYYPMRDMRRTPRGPLASSSQLVSCDALDVADASRKVRNAMARRTFYGRRVVRRLLSCEIYCSEAH